jgi:hypothetical protein
MANLLDTLATVTLTAYILFGFILGVWAAYLGLTGRGLSGQFWGAMWMCTLLAVAELVLFLLRWALGAPFDRPIINILYGAYFIVALPGTFAILRGRDDRVAALIFAGVAIFSALAAISYLDAQGVRPPLFEPGVTPTVVP